MSEKSNFENTRPMRENTEIDEDTAFHLTDQARSDYLSAPHTCPFCRSQELDATGDSVNGYAEIHQTVVCLECRRKWTDVYVLQRIGGVQKA